MHLLLRLVLVAFVLAGCSSEGLGGVTVVTSGRHEVGAARLLGDVVVLDGTLRLPEGSGVAGSIHVLGGVVVVAGEVDGDITVVSGRLQLEPGAVIRGDASVSAGGTLDMAEGAIVQGALGEGLTVDVGVDPAGFDPVSLVLRFTLLTLAIAGVRQLAPRRTRLVAGWAGQVPAASGAYGFLLALVGLSLAVFMAFTIVLAPVALILLVLSGLGVLLGLAGMAAAIDDRIGRSRRWRRGPGTVACAATLTLAPSMPAVGLLATIVVATVALGALGLSLQRGDVRQDRRGRGTTGAQSSP